ncbi:MAG: hypothetical protein QOD38_1231 [Acidimicrobiaceae bacterium]|jgi:hypothetical protein
MSSSRLTVVMYRHAMHLYPRGFREEYGDDLVVLLSEQLRDEPAWRVTARTVVDLALTVPTRHLEATMHRSMTPFVPPFFGALALSSLIVGLVVGRPIVLLACLAIAGLAGGLGLAAHRRARPVAAPATASAQWWKVLVSGVGLMAALIVVTTATGELPDNGWFVAMITGLTAIVLMSTGVVLGITHLATRPSRHAAL